jgi:hypothetical protein
VQHLITITLQPTTQILGTNLKNLNPINKPPHPDLKHPNTHLKIEPCKLKIGSILVVDLTKIVALDSLEFLKRKPSL